MTDDQVIDALPQTLAEIARSCGLGVALTLAREHGGTRLWLPRNPGPNTMLARCVGELAARRIVAHFGGGAELVIPLGPTSDHRQQQVRIERLIQEGKSNNEIARQLRCHRRTVERHRQALRDDREPPLLPLMRS